jgi:hypothetical protein
LGEVSNKNALPEMGRHLIFWSRVLFKRLYFEKRDSTLKRLEKIKLEGDLLLELAQA